MTDYRIPRQGFPDTYPGLGPIMPAPQGWSCPKCGSVWAPTTPGCFTCNKDKKP